MSEQSKQTIKEIETTFKRIAKEADDASQRANKLGDKGLSTKILKVKESSEETVKHIVERSDKKS